MVVGDKYKMTFDEIYKETIACYKGGGCDGREMDMPNDERHSIAGMLKSLAFMVEHKLVRTEIEI